MMMGNANYTFHTAAPSPPARFSHRPAWQYILWLCFGALLISAMKGAGLSDLTLQDLVNIPSHIGYVLTRMCPPSLERLDMVSRAMLQTLEMALVGNILGIPLSFGLAVLCARNLTPHPIIYYAVRFLVTFLRTTPSLVWAIFLIVAVGLGPRSGTLTLVIATMGFCGRFFAESMEEVDPGPREALTAIGAGCVDAVVCAVMPMAMPAFINTVLFNLEHTTRSSAVLGLVGAGGIGIELLVSIQTFHYDEAATILIYVFVMVLGVEQLCAWIRRKVLSVS
jgi:phosphonate transport system permease protein